MPFASQVFIDHQLNQRPLSVYNIFQGVGWRWIFFARIYVQLNLWTLQLIYSYTFLYVGYIYLLVWFLAYGKAGKIPTMNDDILANIDSELVIFVNNGRPFIVPCSRTAEDKDLLEQIRIFYDLQRIRYGMFELIGAKSIQRIDVAKLHSREIVGKRLKESLDLGLLGSYGRQAHYFEKPSELTGDHIQKRLIRQQVLTTLGQQKNALNIIRSWDPQITTTVILFPIVLSLIISIVWSVVASAKFKADVQTSTQTGFTIGSYVVTAGISPRHSSGPLDEWLILAGALLVALVAFLDGKVNGMEH
ncbi:hypothetical protein ACET3X_002252 [Alternaria dauci]|uniref:Uncharacterized protein n=1 Tax=Alternaria dauci TaxID=48095 RepID=A0ABR3UQA4_9PLEO